MNTSQSEQPAEHQPHDGWQPCPAGAIQAVADRQTQLQRKAAMGRRAIVGACVLLIAAGAALVFSGGNASGTLPGGIACSSVRAHADDYVAGTLDAELTQQVSAHCEHCSSCRHYIASLQAVTWLGPPATNGIAIAMLQ